MNPGTPITYNGNSLQTTNIITMDMPQGAPTIDGKQYTLAHANKSKIPFLSYPNRTIVITGRIIGSSVADCDNQIDTFKSYLIGVDKQLNIGNGSGTRQYIATPTEITVPRPGGLAYAEFTVKFTCNSPFGQDTTTTTALSQTGRTSSTYNDVYTFLGTAPHQLAIVTITLVSVTGATNGSIEWGNGNNGQQVFIQNSTWNNGDVIVIDCGEKTVTYNGSPQGFSGAFPEFPPGSQTMQYTDTFATRTFNISVVYTAEYM